MIFNPHKKHGYVSGDVNTPFYVAMEQAHYDYENTLKEFNAADHYSITALVRSRLKYEILRACAYSGDGGRTRRLEQLEQAVDRLGLFVVDDSTSPIVKAAHEFRRQVAKVVVAELRESSR